MDGAFLGCWYNIQRFSLWNWKKCDSKEVPFAVFSSAFVALLAAGDTSAALLFQDRHAGVNGEETIYRFEAKAASAASPIEQSKAVKVATVWAAQYYGIGNLTVANTQERSMPIHYWLIAFTAPGQSKGGTYYSIVMPDGAVVEKVSRQNLTASANPIDVTKNTELTAPVKGLEVHGEVIFEYGWGKGRDATVLMLRAVYGMLHRPLLGRPRN